MGRNGTLTLEKPTVTVGGMKIAVELTAVSRIADPPGTIGQCLAYVPMPDHWYMCGEAGRIRPVEMPRWNRGGQEWTSSGTFVAMCLCDKHWDRVKA